MNNGLEVNKKIYAILSGDEALTAMIGSNCFPIIAEENATFPLVTFSRDSMYPEYSKDFNTGDIVEVSVQAVGNNYIQTVDILSRIRTLLENRQDDYFKRSTVIGATEAYIDNVYVQTLIFRFLVR